MTHPMTPEADDPLLLARLRHGDERAFALVYQRYVAGVVAVAERIVVDRRAAEDVAQEVFVYLWRHADRVDPARGNLRVFLHVLTRQRAIDQLRREASHLARHERAAQQRHDAGDDASIDVADLLAAADLDTRRASAVRSALLCLPAAQRTSVELAYFAGRSYRDVAQLMGVPEGTAKSRLRLALRRLAEQLPPAGLDPAAEPRVTGLRAS